MSCSLLNSDHQISSLQRDSAGVATQNNELRFRLQAMEQQAQLRDGACLQTHLTPTIAVLSARQRPTDVLGTR
jgi:hypothetical protein